MASLAMVFRPALCRKWLVLQNKQIVRSVGHWNKDFKPSKVPQTEAEKAAAAQKYGLIPADYQTYTDDGTGLGDYPKLPIISPDMRDPHYNYDYPELKRDFGEPVHAEYVMYTEERLSAARTRYTYPQMLTAFVSVMALIFALREIGEIFPYGRPAMPKQYPKSGVVHYTFETVE